MNLWSLTESEGEAEDHVYKRILAVSMTLGAMCVLFCVAVTFVVFKVLKRRRAKENMNVMCSRRCSRGCPVSVHSLLKWLKTLTQKAASLINVKTCLSMHTAWEYTCVSQNPNVEINNMGWFSETCNHCLPTVYGRILFATLLLYSSLAWGIIYIAKCFIAVGYTLMW